MTDRYTHVAEVTGVDRAAVKRVALALGYSGQDTAADEYAALEKRLKEFGKDDSEMSTATGFLVRHHVRKLLRHHQVRNGVLEADLVSLILSVNKRGE